MDSRWQNGDVGRRGGRGGERPGLLSNGSQCTFVHSWHPMPAGCVVSYYRGKGGVLVGKALAKLGSEGLWLEVKGCEGVTVVSTWCCAQDKVVCCSRHWGGPTVAGQCWGAGCHRGWADEGRDFVLKGCEGVDAVSSCE